jgi:hypothetical protein
VGNSQFGIRLWRLLSQRRPTVTSSIDQMQPVLTRDAGLSGAELAAVVNDGVVPSPDLVRRLAPALEIHTADLFVVAGLPVPDDLASAWPTSPWNIGSIVQAAIGMNTDQRRQLQALVRSLPAVPRTGAAPADDDPDTPAALLLRLLRNRNISPYNARILHAVGDGPYVSDATIAGLAGRVVITAQYVTAFAHLLGYQPSDVVALTGVGPVVKDAQVHPASAELAALAWQARRLSSGQLGDVMAAARTIQAA